MGGISTLSTREQLQINRKLHYEENEGKVREGEGINCSERVGVVGVWVQRTAEQVFLA